MCRYAFSISFEWQRLYVAIFSDGQLSVKILCIFYIILALFLFQWFSSESETERVIEFSVNSIVPHSFL